MNDDYEKRIDEAIKLVNDNHIEALVRAYIIKKFELEPSFDNLSISESRRIHATLQAAGYTTEMILSGKADYEIEPFVREKVMRIEAVIKDKEEKHKQPLKTTKKYYKAKVISGLIAATLAVSSLVAVSEPLFNDEIDTHLEASQTIGMAVSDFKSDDYKYKRNIVEQNTYVVGYDEVGHPIVAYHNDRIAEDVISLCVEDPSLFDVCMHTIYFDMSDNRLENMDAVLRYLKSYMANDSALVDIFSQIESYGVFLEYVLDSVYQEQRNSEYSDLQQDIEEYKANKTAYEVTYNKLPEKTQKRIQQLINDYKKSGKALYSEYQDNLENLEGDNFGTR